MGLRPRTIRRPHGASGENPLVARDYYAVLGVTPTSEDVVIRAAYRALMRRYHPDTDPGSDASERAQEIAAAYAILGDPEKRARYDGSAAAQGLIKPERARQNAGKRIARRRADLIALGMLAIAITAIALAPPIGDGPPDALPRRVAAPPARVAAAETADIFAPGASEDTGFCNRPGVPELIRDELARRAAIIRGGHGGQLASYTFVRLDSVTARGEQGAGAAGCTASLSVTLPPELIAESGRSNLNGDVSFGLVETAEHELRLASLTGADALVRSLAAAGPAPARDVATGLPEPDRVAALVNSTPAVVRPAPVEAAKPKALERKPVRSEPATAAAAPACRALTGWADRAVCDNRNLTGLDRQLALLYGQSLDRADSARRTALASTRERFVGRRNACRSEACLTSAYVARLREVSDIMARRTQQ
jgi:hypothetical protein